ncbi:MAG: hypothetical protein ACMXYD_04415 [Candidatus Woesearchaeota archaeon]
MHSVFREVFGSSPVVRIIDFFLDNQEFAYSLADVIREEGISFSTAKPVFSWLIASGVLVLHVKEGKACKYVLNRQHEFVKSLLALDAVLVEHVVV